MSNPNPRYPHIMVSFNKSKIYQPMSFKEHMDIYRGDYMDDTQTKPKALSVNNVNLINLDGIEEIYILCRDKFLKETIVYSYTDTKNINYIRLIDLGVDIIPFIINDLRNDEYSWLHFQLFLDLSNVNPIKDDNRGKFVQVRNDILDYYDSNML